MTTYNAPFTEFKAKKGDVIICVSWEEDGTESRSEVLVMAWGKKRATLIDVKYIGTKQAEWMSYNTPLKNGFNVRGEWMPSNYYEAA